MKLVEYKQFGEFEESRKLNKKKIAVVSAVLAVVLIIAIIILIYVSNSKFRDLMDKYILMKNINDSNVAYIQLDADERMYTYAYHDYVVILKNNELNLYNNSGKCVQTLKVNISSPIFETKGKYLVIAEKNQQKVYLIKDKKIIWENNVEGNISRVTVNENGYVSIIVSGTSYKSVITTIDNKGMEIFKTFLSSSIATNVAISNDNKFLSFCELDISGSLIESKVKTISIENAKQKPENSIIYTYQMPSNTIIADLQYHQRNELICMSESKIFSLKNGSVNEIDSIQQENTSFAGILFSKGYFKVVENMNGINNQMSIVEIYNTNSKNHCEYKVNGIAKSVYSVNGIVAVNVGTEVYFINEKGWLIKKFTSTQEIRDIVVADNIAGIISKNKIQFIGL